MEENRILFEDLPTGKKHISFSEVKLWKECSYRHKLFHINKIDLSKPSPILEFGTAVHSACEDYLLTRQMKPEICFNALDAAWEQHSQTKEFTKMLLETSKEEAHLILSEVPAFLDDTFPGWETVDAEHQLYESIEGHPHAFKGFIDGVIKTKGKKGEDLYWILDWKTSQYGWMKNKKSDEVTKYQLALYKNFWQKKNPNVPFKNIRCGFVILKKKAKPGKHCELFSASIGDVPIKRSLKVIGNMISSVKRGISIKNRDSCMYCEFKNTEHCT